MLPIMLFEQSKSSNAKFSLRSWIAPVDRCLSLLVEQESNFPIKMPKQSRQRFCRGLKKQRRCRRFFGLSRSALFAPSPAPRTRPAERAEADRLTNHLFHPHSSQKSKEFLIPLIPLKNRHAVRYCNTLHSSAYLQQSQMNNSHHYLFFLNNRSQISLTNGDLRN